MVTLSISDDLAGTEVGSRVKHEVEAKLCDIEQVLERGATPSEGSESEVAGAESEEHNEILPSVAARRVLLRPNQQVNIDNALLLNKAYAVESALLMAVQEFFISSMLEGDSIDGGVHSTEPMQGVGNPDTDRGNSNPKISAEEEDAEAYRGVSASLLEYELVHPLLFEAGK